MDKPRYDPMLQIVVPIGMLDDLVSVHLEPAKGEKKEGACKHCEAMQLLGEIRLAAAAGADQLKRIAKAKLAHTN